jgi:hypothetical protein
MVASLAPYGAFYSDRGAFTNGSSTTKWIYLEPGLRSFPIGRYVILYNVERNDGVVIARVIPGERDIPPPFRLRDASGAR